MTTTPLDFAHRIWRMLPKAPRRYLYDFVTKRAASYAAWTDETPKSPKEPYIVAGPLSAPTGLGEASRLVLYALKQAGRDVSAIDLSSALMQPSLVPLPDLPQPRAGPGTLLLMSQPPSVAHSLALIGSKLLADKLRVGLWAWELEQLPDSWIQSRRYMHALAAPSQFCQDAYARAFREPVRLTPYPVTASPPARTRIKSASMSVRFGAALDLGSTNARKNPLAVIETYLRAFGSSDKTSLYLKIRDPGADDSLWSEIYNKIGGLHERIYIEKRNLDNFELEQWWSNIDVLVSLHRSEGFGLVVAGAMQRGIPVISTDWSSTAEFVNTENGWPIPATLIPAADPTGRYAFPSARWADPDIEAAVAAMHEAVRDRAALLQKSENAIATIRNQFSVEAFLRNLEQ